MILKKTPDHSPDTCQKIERERVERVEIKGFTLVTFFC